MADRFVDLAGDINRQMPKHVAELVEQALAADGRSIAGARIGVIGVAFKPNVHDTRNSPAADVIARLAEQGAEVCFHDPHATSFTDAAGIERRSVMLDELLAGSELLLVLVRHAAIDWPRVYERARLVVDTVNSSAAAPRTAARVLRLGAGWRAG
jgi:UDP-N-acetyl-D-glucosamine dehydrogenase